MHLSQELSQVLPEQSEASCDTQIEWANQNKFYQGGQKCKFNLIVNSGYVPTPVQTPKLKTWVSPFAQRK